ncbi:hypothetical protein LY76DRAFT_73321 [Colletotrichum caudatum]|nr:hypothetical protein LY76DRAFT_73321 [Colletotrichum caudatum]
MEGNAQRPTLVTGTFVYGVFTLSRQRLLLQRTPSSSLHPTHRVLRGCAAHATPRQQPRVRRPHATEPLGWASASVGPVSPGAGPAPQSIAVDSSTKSASSLLRLPSPPAGNTYYGTSLTRTAIEHATYASSVHVGSSQSPPLLLDRRPAHVVQVHSAVRALTRPI